MTMGTRGAAWVGGVVLVLVLVVVGGLAWMRRGDILGLVQGDPPAVEVSEEAAATAETKLERLRAAGEPVSLSDVELSSLLRYRGPQWALGVVHEPGVEMSGDTLRLTGTIPTEGFAAEPEFAEVRDFLPDSARLEIVGRVSPLRAGRASLDVLQVELAGIPVPERYYPGALQRLGRVDEPGLAPASYPVRLPEGVGSARVEGGRLILTP